MRRLLNIFYNSNPLSPDETLDSVNARYADRWPREIRTLQQTIVHHILTNLRSFSREAIIKLPIHIHAMLYEQFIRSHSDEPEDIRNFICDSLASLSFNNLQRCSEEGLEEIITLLESQAHGSVKTLTMMCGRYEGTVSHNQARRILKSQPNIQEIHVFDHGILHLLPTNTPQLRNLTQFFSHKGITDYDIKALSSLTDLTRLVLYNFTSLEENEPPNSESYMSEAGIMTLLENLTKLEELETCCNGVHWGLLNYIEKYRQSRPLKLQFFQTYSIDSDQISVIVKHLPDLKHLRLMKYQNFEALRRLGDVTLTKLEYIRGEIRGDPSEHLADDLYHFLTYAGEKLQSLSLMFSDIVVDLSEIGRFCPQISYIRLEVINISEKSKYKIEDESFSKLEYFLIIIKTMLPQAVLVHVLTRPSLKEFDFEGGTPIPTRVFARVFQCAKNNKEVFSNLTTFFCLPSTGINIVDNADRLDWE